jgi:hypothetical protein
MPYLTPNTPGGLIVRRVLSMPDEYLLEIYGALDELARLYNWEQSGTETQQQAADRMTAMIEDFKMATVTSDVNGKTGALAVWSPSSTPADWLFVADATCHAGGYFHMTNNNQNNEVAFKLSLNIGACDFAFLLSTNAVSGIAHVVIGATEIGSFDCYSAATTPNVFKKISNIAIDAETVTMTIKMTSKNAASTAWALRLQALAWNAH